MLTAHTPALDIDVMHQEAAEYVEDLANYSFDGRGTFLLRYGNKPKRAILFRTETPFAKRQVRFQDKDGVEHKVEFLGDGQQLVVAGVHPDTHQPYAWEEFTPWDIAHEDLPLIDEAQVDTFLAMVAEGLVADFGFTLLGGQAVNGQDKPADKAISPGNIHNGQVAQIASLIRGGMSLDLAVEEVLEATRAAGDPNSNWKREERAIRGQGLSFIAKNTELSSALPDALRTPFEALVAAGGNPKFRPTRDGRWEIVGAPTTTTSSSLQSAPPLSRLVMRCAADIEPEPIEWVWDKRIAKGKLTVIGGEPEEGKSQIGVYIAAMISAGGAWPNSEGKAIVGSVIILSAEDGAEDTLVPRLIAAGADRSKIHILDAVRQTDGKGQRTFSLATDLRLLGEKIAELGDVQAVIVDPASAYLGGKVDSHNDTSVRGVLAPVAEMASRLQVAIISIMHFNKGNAQHGTRVIHRFMASIAFVAAARVAFAAVRDPEDDKRHLFLHAKNNLAEPSPDLAYTIEQSIVTDAKIVTSRIVWDFGSVDMTAAEALAPQERDTPVLDDATAFLRDLVPPGHRMAQKDIEREAKAAGYAMRTVRRAKDKLKMKSVKPGMGEGWAWEMLVDQH